MARIGKNLIADSGLVPFFKLVNADEVSIDAPENRKGDALIKFAGGKLKLDDVDPHELDAGDFLFG